MGKLMQNVSFVNQWRNQDFRKGGGGGWYIFVITISSLLLVIFKYHVWLAREMT